MAQNNDANDDVRTDEMTREMAETFEEYEIEYREDDDYHTVVYEDDECIIVADDTGNGLNEWASEFDVDRDDLRSTFRAIADEKMGEQDAHDVFSYSDPVVFEFDDRAEIESTLVFDVEHYADYEPFERVAEGIHERGDRKTEYVYNLDQETDETLLRVHARYYLDGELKNESGRDTQTYKVVDGVVTTNGQGLEEFVTANFNADPEVSLGDEFESMVDA